MLGRSGSYLYVAFSLAAAVNGCFLKYSYKCQVQAEIKTEINNFITAWYFPWHQLSILQTFRNNIKTHLSQARVASGEPLETLK